MHLALLLMFSLSILLLLGDLEMELFLNFAYGLFQGLFAIDINTFFPLLFLSKDPLISNNSVSKKKSESAVCNLVRDVSKVDAEVSSPFLVRDVTCEDDKGKIMEEVMRTYVKQQEKLNSILQKKQQLQMVN